MRPGAVDLQDGSGGGARRGDRRAQRDPIDVDPGDVPGDGRDEVVARGEFDVHIGLSGSPDSPDPLALPLEGVHTVVSTVRPAARAASCCASTVTPMGSSSMATRSVLHAVTSATGAVMSESPVSSIIAAGSSTSSAHRRSVVMSGSTAAIATVSAPAARGVGRTIVLVPAASGAGTSTSIAPAAVVNVSRVIVLCLPSTGWVSVNGPAVGSVVSTVIDEPTA